MSQTENRIPLSIARELADELVALIAPYCERVEVVGAIRRKVTFVSDLDILYVPKLSVVQAALLDGDDETDNQVTQELQRIDRETGEFILQTCGPRMQSGFYKSVRFDLFGVLPPAQWGVLMMIRTGPAELSRANVTRHESGGHLPPGHFVRDGALWSQEVPSAPEVMIPTPEEADFYAAIGRRHSAPEERL